MLGQPENGGDILNMLGTSYTNWEPPEIAGRRQPENVGNDLKMVGTK